MFCLTLVGVLSMSTSCCECDVMCCVQVAALHSFRPTPCPTPRLPLEQLRKALLLVRAIEGTSEVGGGEGESSCVGSAVYSSLYLYTM